MPFEYKVGGSLPRNAPSYVIRPADDELYHALLNGDFCYVLNSRQMGKSSLRVRTMQRLQDGANVACCAIDLTSIGSKQPTPEEWYSGIVRSLVRGLKLTHKVNLRTWLRERDFISAVQRLAEFIEDVLLVEISQPIVIFVDEIDSILSLDFPTDDFFALIRACYNERADKPEYQRITFCLLGVATPSNLIKDIKRTPFNIGRAIELQGLEFSNAKPLIDGLGKKVKNPTEVVKTILDWTGGQPFLTQKVCDLFRNNLLEKSELTVLQVENSIRTNIIDNWEAQDNPEHLRTIRDRILKDEEQAVKLLGLYQQILNPSPNNSPSKDLTHTKISADTSKPLQKLPPTQRLIEDSPNPLKNGASESQVPISEGDLGESQNQDNNNESQVPLPKGDLGGSQNQNNNNESQVPLPKGDLGRSQNQDNIELRLSGLVVLSQGKLQPYNRIYQEVFNQEWVTKALANLRPYAVNLSKWLASASQDGKKDDSLLLQGKDLEQALAWATKHNLSDDDYRYISASQQLDRREVEKEAQARLAQVKKQTKRQIFIGAVVLGLSLLGAVGIGILGIYTEQAKQKALATIQLQQDALEAVAEFNYRQIPGLLKAMQAGQTLKTMLPKKYSIADYPAFSPLLSLQDMLAKINTLEGHSGSVYGVAVAPDGKTIVSGSQDNTIKVWDSTTGKLIRTLEGHSGSVWGVAVAPDGKTIVSGSSDNTIKLWYFDIDKLLSRGCDWLSGYLINNPNELAELEVCQDDKSLLLAAAPVMLQLGENLARKGKYEDAVTKLKTAKKWKPQLKINPENRAKSLSLVFTGREKANQADLQGAIKDFQQAQKLDSKLDLDPDKEGVQSNPQVTAKKLVALALIPKGEEYLKQKNFNQALKIYTDIAKLQPPTETLARSWNSFCWVGSLHGFAKNVVNDACKKAVSLAPNHAGILDSRGLARVLTGDIEGAIPDFEAFIESTEYGNAEEKAKRQRWVKELKAGENPFTKEEIEKLRRE